MYEILNSSQSVSRHLKDFKIAVSLKLHNLMILGV